MVGRMKRITHYIVLAAVALALALAATASAKSGSPNMTCGSCGGNGGGTYAWGPCNGYPIGTIGQDSNTAQPIECEWYNGSPTWIPF